MSGMARPAAAAAVAVLSALGCSRDAPKARGPAEASPPAARLVPACSLLTGPEVAQATGHAIANAVAQDSLFAPGYWTSNCVFRLAGASGPAAVVTVAVSGDYPAVMDAAELADAVSAEAMGISARPLEGWPLPAAVYPDTGVVVQKGAVRLLVTGRQPDAVRALAAAAAAHLP